MFITTCTTVVHKVYMCNIHKQGQEYAFILVRPNTPEHLQPYIPVLSIDEACKYECIYKTSLAPFIHDLCIVQSLDPMTYKLLHCHPKLKSLFVTSCKSVVISRSWLLPLTLKVNIKLALLCNIQDLGRQF